jgi:NitT/TauT family transport system ATP-binding protein
VTRLSGGAREKVNRKFGMLFQSAALFDSLPVWENVGFALIQGRGLGRAEAKEIALQKLAKVGLNKDVAELSPSELSGGMQKRCSIIRTLIYDPEVILMDDPFGPLDAQTRLILQDELLRVWDENKKTILFVTHDLTEAIALSDKVVLFTGRPGTVKRIFDVPLPRPRNVFEIHNEKGFTDTYHEIWQYFRSEIKV